MRTLSKDVYTVPVFVFLWVLSSIIEVLPNADQRTSWAAKSIVAGSLFRAAVLIGVAWFTREVEAVLQAMIVIALFKLIMLFVYTLRFHGLPTEGMTFGDNKKTARVRCTDRDSRKHV